jgi:hypothetical protein
VVTLYYTDVKGMSLPVNYRLVNKKSGQTKHDYFLEMMAEVIAWGLKPSTVTGDSWYGKIKTLTTLKTRSGGSLRFTNRSVALEHGKYVQVQSLDIPEDGLIVYLKKVGRVKVFRTVFKNEFRTTPCLGLPRRNY